MAQQQQTVLRVLTNIPDENLLVTDGNLNDAQCEQFLTVNTTPTNYSIFPYFVYRENDTLQGTNPFGVFINNLTTPPKIGRAHV